MGDADESARIENGKHAGIVKTGGVSRAIFDLEAETESVSIGVPRVTRWVIHLGAIERRARASRVGDCEGVLGEGAQDSTGIVEEPEGLVTGVGDDRGDLQVLQSIDVGVGGRGLERQARDSGDEDREGSEGDERRREHCGEGSQGG